MLATGSQQTTIPEGTAQIPVAPASITPGMGDLDPVHVSGVKPAEKFCPIQTNALVHRCWKFHAKNMFSRRDPIYRERRRKKLVTEQVSEQYKKLLEDVHRCCYSYKPELKVSDANLLRDHIESFWKSKYAKNKKVHKGFMGYLDENGVKVLIEDDGQVKVSLKDKILKMMDKVHQQCNIPTDEAGKVNTSESSDGVDPADHFQRLNRRQRERCRKDRDSLQPLDLNEEWKTEWLTWYYKDSNDVQQGPVTEDALRGLTTMETLVRHKTQHKWEKRRHAEALMKHYVLKFPSRPGGSEDTMHVTRDELRDLIFQGQIKRSEDVAVQKVGQPKWEPLDKVISTRRLLPEPNDSHASRSIIAVAQWVSVAVILFFVARFLNRIHTSGQIIRQRSC